jgi:hypothetical protein
MWSSLHVDGGAKASSKLCCVNVTQDRITGQFSNHAQLSPRAHNGAFQPSVGEAVTKLSIWQMFASYASNARRTFRGGVCLNPIVHTNLLLVKLARRAVR